MMKHIRENVRDIEDEDEVYAYLIKILKKEVFDRKGRPESAGFQTFR